MAGSLHELRQIELTKGVLFVTVTALAVFFGSKVTLSRIERANAGLAARDRAILANERRVLTGVLAASIAHDANNVLIAVIADLDQLRGAVGHDHGTVKRLQRSLERLIALNQRLLTTARRGRAAMSADVDLAQGVQEALEVIGSHEQVRGCRLSFYGNDATPLRVHPLLMHQIVSNLVVNAGEATLGRGRVEVRLAPRDGGIALEVHDDGPGVAPERRERIFDALETTKAEGSGLGLFSVKSCAAALGGTVEAADSPLGGACFRVLLPIPATK